MDQLDQFKDIIFTHCKCPLTKLDILCIQKINNLLLKCIHYSSINQYNHYEYENIIDKIQNNYKKLFTEIYNYQVQISKYDIVRGITNILQSTSINDNSILLLWNYDTCINKSVINYNFLFCYNLYNISKNIYITNFTPNTLLTGEEINEPVCIKTTDTYNFLLKHKCHDYFIFDDMSYSGNQLMDDCKKWYDYIICNFSNDLDLNCNQFTLHIFLYGITYHSYYQYCNYIDNLSTIEYGHLLNSHIFFKLNVCKYFYSPLPIIFDTYCYHKYSIQIQYKYHNEFVQQTINVCNKMSKKNLIKFGDFYFANEINEFLKFGTKRYQTLIYLDYKIPDSRSINDRLFFGYVPKYLLNQYLFNNVIVGTFNTIDVYQLQFFTSKKPIKNFIFQSINSNCKEFYDTFCIKSLVPWYKSNTS